VTSVLRRLVLLVISLVVVAAPVQTIGWLADTVNQASFGVLEAFSTGSTNNPQRALGTSLHGLFVQSISRPWCWMEFGDSGPWCTDPGKVDADLTKARTQLLADGQSAGKVQKDPRGPLYNPRTANDERGQDLALLSRAHANGEMFLAFPVDDKPRNAAAEDHGLFHALCQATSVDDCTGPNRARAQQRSQRGVLLRIFQLLIIGLGIVLMGVVVLFIVARLIWAQLEVLFLLPFTLLTALAAALGAAGEKAAADHLTRLLGAVLAKLAYSAVLGVALLTVTTLNALHLPFLADWLLIALFWIALFLKRDVVIEWAKVGHHEMGSGARNALGSLYFGSQLARMGGRAIGAGRGGGGRPRPPTGAGDGNGRPSARALAGRGALLAGAAASGPAGAVLAGAAVAGAAGKALSDRRLIGPERSAQRGERLRAGQDRMQLDGITRHQAQAAAGTDVGREQGRLDNLRHHQGVAAAAGDTRRAHSLDRRAQATAGRITAAENAKTYASRLAEFRQSSGQAYPDRPQQRVGAFLDQQAQLQPAGAQQRSTAPRDYQQLAPLAGLTPAAYTKLTHQHPGYARGSRLKIDRELAARTQATGQASDARKLADARGRAGRTQRSDDAAARRARQFDTAHRRQRVR